MKDTPPDGVIRIEVDEVSKPIRTVKSPEVEVKGVPWNVAASVVPNFIGLSLVCTQNQTTPWSIDVQAEFILIHPDIGEDFTIEKSGVCKNLEYVQLKMSTQGAVIKPFIKDDKITIEIRFWITEMRGINPSKVREIDFTDPNEPCHDIALLIGGEKIYTSKQILAASSPVFHVLFYSEFAEKNKKEIELKEVNREQFIELLRVIYPSSRSITCYSIDYLLKLGDRFDIECVMNRAELFLIASHSSNETKLKYASNYRLFALKEHVFSNLKTVENVKEIEESSDFGSLSDEMKADLLKHKARIEA